MRTVVLLPVLARRGDRPAQPGASSPGSGPRGLSSLLLILLPVFAGVPGSERLFAITCLVVLLSVALHGTGIALFLRKREGPTTAPARRHRAPVTHEPDPDAKIPERITLEEFRQLREAGKPVVLADVRTERSYRADNLKAAGRHPAPARRRGAPSPELGLDHHGDGSALLCVKG